MTIDVVLWFNRLFVLDAVAFVDQSRPRRIGDSLVQRRVGRSQVLLHQEGGNVQSLGAMQKEGHKEYKSKTID